MALKNLKVDIITEMRKVVKDPRKRRALTPTLKKSEVKIEIGERIIELMIERTLNGNDKRGNKFKAYSKSYPKTDNYKIYKSGDSNPNLKLTGDMLASVDVVKVNPNGIEIGFKRDAKLQKLKAEGHVEGKAGKRGWALPIRDFWGLPQGKDMEKLIDETVSEVTRFDGLLIPDTPSLLELLVGDQETEIGG